MLPVTGRLYIICGCICGDAEYVVVVRFFGLSSPLVSLSPQVQQRIAVQRLAIENDGGDAARVPDVGGGIGVEDENVGAAAGGDKAEFAPSELQRVVVGGGGKGLARREAEPDQKLESVCSEMPGIVPMASAPDAAR